MKIESLKTPGIGAPARPAGKTAPPAESAGGSGAATDVRLSSASAALNTQTADVDALRVQEIRQAIAEGRFEINASAIADRLINSARELIGSRRQV